jgi:hypothetical protein
MGTSGLSHRHPPVLAGGKVDGDEVIYHRDLRFETRSLFEAELYEWMCRYMTKSRVAALLQEASGLDEVVKYLQSAPVTMDLSGKRTIYAHLIWGRRANGDWWVRGLGFSIRDSVANINSAKKNQYRERLEQQAEERALKRGPAEWELWFAPPQGCGDFLADVKKGQGLVANLISNAHKKAKALEPMLKNPIGPDMDSDGSIALETGKAIIGAIVPGSKFDKPWTVIDGGHKVVENIKEQSGWKLAGDTMDVGLGLATGNPLTGLGSVILGSFLEIGIANDAGRVAKARARLYAFYVSGLFSKLIGQRREKPATKAEQEMLKLGAADGAALTPCGKYQVQLAILHYAGTHNITNQWSFQNHFDQGWVYPTDYQRNWSPSMLARSLVWQFGKLKYLIK